ncbi:MAG: hypothetical protein GY719_09850 [bacterium]|nr:hypothetical protein [bacterium]
MALSSSAGRTAADHVLKWVENRSGSLVEVRYHTGQAPLPSPTGEGLRTGRGIEREFDEGALRFLALLFDEANLKNVT